METRRSLPTMSLLVSVKSSPAARLITPGSVGPVLYLIPGTSTMTPRGRLMSADTLRTTLSASRCSLMVPCERLSLAMLMPDSASDRTVSSVEVAGPSVHTIFVFGLAASIRMGTAPLPYSPIMQDSTREITLAYRLWGPSRRCLSRHALYVSPVAWPWGILGPCPE